jgi:NAD-dependent dihydropyrimidine dehydrogenase PreA subunit
MEVCLIVGDPAAEFIADQNPKFRRISQEEAVKVLEDSHQRGEIHAAYFKREIGNRFFAICNCCSCCCMGVKMWNMIGGIPAAKEAGDLCFLVPSGYVAEVATDICQGCGTCVDTSNNFDCMTMDEDENHPVIDLTKCMGCGGCEGVCPEGAISLRLDPSKGNPLDIENIRL